MGQPPNNALQADWNPAQLLEIQSQGLSFCCSVTSSHGFQRLSATDDADALRRVIALRIAIRFLAGATRLAIKRMQRTLVRTSKLALPPAADPQGVMRR